MLTIILLVGCKVTHFSCTIQIFKDKLTTVTEKMCSINITEVLEYAQRFRGAFPELPMDGLAVEVKGIIRQLAAEKHVPTNYVLGAVLTSFGCVLGRKVVIRDGAYWNYPNLYSCQVGYAGSGKTPSVQHVLKPIKEFDAKEKKEYVRELRRAKADGSEQPPFNCIIVSNITTEKLFRILDKKQNDRFNTGLLLHSGELLSHFGNLDRYNSGNSRPFYLDMYSCQDISVDRMYDDEGVLIEKPFLSILGDIQPRELRRMFPENDSSGFFSRWCFFLSNGKSERVQENAVYMNHWCDTIERAIEMPSMELTFSAEVLPLLESNDQEREMLCDYLAESNSELAEYIIKQNYTVRRIAGIVHSLNSIVKGYVPNPEIGKDVYEYAENLVSFFIRAAAVVQQMRSASSVDKLTSKALIQKVNEKHPIKNISQFAESIGVSKQYVSSCILRKDTTRSEKHERMLEDAYYKWAEYIVKNHQTLFYSVGRLPTMEEVESWLVYDDEVIKATLKKMEVHHPSGYTILFSQFVSQKPEL